MIEEKFTAIPLLTTLLRDKKKISQDQHAGYIDHPFEPIKDDKVLICEIDNNDYVTVDIDDIQDQLDSFRSYDIITDKDWYSYQSQLLLSVFPGDGGILIINAAADQPITDWIQAYQNDYQDRIISDYIKKVYRTYGFYEDAQKKRAYDKQMQDAFQPTEPIKIETPQEFIQYVIDCNEYIQKSNQYLIAQYGSQNIPDQPGIKRVLLFGVENHMDNYDLLEFLPHKNEHI